jgi:glycosyltransferase involved in cell wall biosynthesis
MTAGSPLLGVLPPLGGSLTDLARHGQLERLLGYYFPAYLERFRAIRYFSYEPEELAAFTADRALLDRVAVVAPGRPTPRRVHAVLLGLGGRRRLLRECAVVRALHAPGALPAVLARVPFVCTYGYSYAAFTGTSVPGALGVKRAAVRQGLRIALRAAELTIATSAAGEEEARSLGADRIERIPNGVDVRLFSPARARPEHDVTFVGQLVPRKDVATLVRALGRLDAGLRLCVVGEGPEEPRLRGLCAAAGVGATFAGGLPNAEVAAVLARSRCFVLPSRAEGQPKALLEALAAGVPCVASDIPGIRELAATGALLTFPPGDDGRLAAAVDRVLTDDDLNARLGREGRGLAVQRFDLERLLERETALLHDLAVLTH